MNPVAYKESYTMTKWDLSQECKVGSAYESNNVTHPKTEDKSQMIISTYK